MAKHSELLNSELSDKPKNNTISKTNLVNSIITLIYKELSLKVDGFNEYKVVEGSANSMIVLLNELFQSKIGKVITTEMTITIQMSDIHTMHIFDEAKYFWSSQNNALQFQCSVFFVNYLRFVDVGNMSFSFSFSTTPTFNSKNFGTL